MFMKYSLLLLGYPETVQVAGACGQGSKSSFFCRCYDNYRQCAYYIEPNNLFSYGIKVRLWSTKLKLIKLPPISQKLKFLPCMF